MMAALQTTTRGAIMKMKTLKSLSFVVLLTAAAGCKQSSEFLADHATPTQVPTSYAYSGADIPASASRGHVYEYH
jgi:hypothetical protein